MLAIDASVQIPASATGEILITAPFSHRIAAPKAEPCKGPKAVFHGANHPIHRARAVAKTLDAVPGLTPQALAVKEKVSPSTICQWRKLVRLSPQVQEALLAIADRATAWRCSLRRLLPLVGLPPAEQWAAFEKIRTGNRVKRGRMSSAGGS